MPTVTASQMTTDVWSCDESVFWTRHVTLSVNVAFSSERCFSTLIPHFVQTSHDLTAVLQGTFQSLLVLSSPAELRMDLHED